MLSLGSLGGSWGLLGKVLGGHWESLEGFWGLGKVLKDSRIVPFGATSVGKRNKRQQTVKIEIVKQMQTKIEIRRGIFKP